MIVYGLRGLAAYAHHAEVLGERDAEVRLSRPVCTAALHRCQRHTVQPHCIAASAARAPPIACRAPPYLLSLLPLSHSPPVFPWLQVDAFMAKAYAFLCSEDALDLGKVLGMVDEVGAAGVKGMRLLDHGESSQGVGWVRGGQGLIELPWTLCFCPCLCCLLILPADPASWPPPCRPHQQVWAPRAHPGSHHPQEGQGGAHQRPRPPGGCQQCGWQQGGCRVAA
jgi:hypothetical protein